MMVLNQTQVLHDPVLGRHAACSQGLPCNRLDQQSDGSSYTLAGTAAPAVLMFQVRLPLSHQAAGSTGCPYVLIFQQP